MTMLFAATRLALLLTVAWCLSLSAPMYGVPVYGASAGAQYGVATLSFIVFEALSGFIAYKRLCFRLGAVHEIWANADRFANLRHLRWEKFPSWALHFWWQPSAMLVMARGLFSSLRGWWVLQCIYEVGLAMLVLAVTTYLFLPDRFNWSTVPIGLAAVAVLASKRALTIYEPLKFCPRG